MSRVTEHYYVAVGKDKKIVPSTLTKKPELLKLWVGNGHGVVSLVLFSNQGYGFVRPLTEEELREIAK